MRTGLLNGVACEALVSHEHGAGLTLRWPGDAADPTPVHCELRVQEPSFPWAVGAQRTIAVDLRDAGVEPAADGSLVLRVGGVPDVGRTLAISVTLRVQADGHGGAHFEATVENAEPTLIVRAVSFPVIGPLAVPAGGAVLWPQGLGSRFDLPLPEGFAVASDYPSGQLTMPWFALAGPDWGLYLGRHDPQMGRFEMSAQGQAGGRSLRAAFRHDAHAGPGATWTSAPVLIRPYRGSWHHAADLYRSWFAQVARPIDIPRWASRSSGWLLAILKQQDGSVLWDYRTGIDRLADLARRCGLDTLGLFGWAHGGHDHLYPDYHPDPLLGGRDALCAALRRARANGIRTVLYANGVIMDARTDFYRFAGNDAILLQQNHEPLVTSIRKYHSSTPVVFAHACPGSTTWRDRMLALARQAHDLGADGILYDQIGVYGPLLCHSTAHRHADPAGAYTHQRRTLIRDIAQQMRAVNPEFVVMTEGMHDTLVEGIGYVHGWGHGYDAPANPSAHRDAEVMMPGLFRYVFPHLPMTNRHPAPLLSRRFANFAFVYGLRFELECRYPADVAYLDAGRIPGPDDYANCAYYPPDLREVREHDREDTAAYLRRLVDLRQRHGDLLLDGRFIDRAGIECDTPGLILTGFRGPAGLAVCVWNPQEPPVTPRVHCAGHRLAACDDPESGTINPQTPLCQQQVRVYRFEIAGLTRPERA